MATEPEAVEPPQNEPDDPPQNEPSNDDEELWGRMGTLIDERLEAGLSKWQAKQNRVSKNSPSKQEPPTQEGPKQKVTRLSEWFRKGLTD